MSRRSVILIVLGVAVLSALGIGGFYWYRGSRFVLTDDARVAANVVSTVRRELELGPAQTRAHARRLAALGVADDGALAAAIRDGSLDHRADEVTRAVRASVRDKLAVANPGYWEAVP
jgi:hypothetical protein